ncbi:MAG: hypothetical protein J6F30_02550 [Cellulosilyticum sp.]|nr:hypothetical protein [Cellulosilyticum sp.]
MSSATTTSKMAIESDVDITLDSTIVKESIKNKQDVTFVLTAYKGDEIFAQETLVYKEKSGDMILVITEEGKIFVN